ncbi:hypothetical protein OZX62_01130 [Bifidobacterium sp. ESL0690]|uniref:hypothetical protein n=1 Tax=Bifidobacterium sp. ESL0690 TaxID=2983214 RepID=UPI0023FA3AE9|nr:hypothetical protein [Bifidobacterium sp. ESL0690]WEV46931.1 hypothetical protein OZX62_01130 [Bifidobacterium sp. ESL0690]
MDQIPMEPMVSQGEGYWTASGQDSWFLPKKVQKPSKYVTFGFILVIVVLVAYFAWYGWIGLHEMQTTGCTIPSEALWQKFCGTVGWCYAWTVAAICAGAIIAFIYMAISTAPKKGQHFGQ